MSAEDKKNKENMKITQHAERFREKISVMSFITMSACDNPISHCTSIDFGIV